MDMIEVRASDLPVILEAVSTQLRLLKSYINKNREDMLRIERFQALHARLERAMLEQ